MMMILNSFSLFASLTVWAADAPTPPKIFPFGDLSEVGDGPEQDAPLLTHEFTESSPTPGMYMVRAEKVRLKPKGCAAALKILLDHPSVEQAPVDLKKSAHIPKIWSTFRVADREAIAECDSFPCDVKLNEKEVQALVSASEADRVGVFWSLVLARAKAYEVSGARTEYEFKGNPMDPWKEFGQRALKSEAAFPKKSHLFARKLVLGDEAREIRQLVDRRSAATPKQATVWLRDLYTAHYFDSWGEWAQLQCQDDGSGLLTLALAVEFDLFKKNDILNRLGRPKMRTTLEAQGKRFLEAWSSQIKAKL